jgi:hypothetical protein
MMYVWGALAVVVLVVVWMAMRKTDWYRDYKPQVEE